MTLEAIDYTRMSDADLDRLHEIVKETERVTEARDLQAIVQAHADFHHLRTHVAKVVGDQRSYAMTATTTGS